MHEMHFVSFVSASLDYYLVTVAWCKSKICTNSEQLGHFEVRYKSKDMETAYIGYRCNRNLSVA